MLGLDAVKLLGVVGDEVEVSIGTLELVDVLVMDGRGGTCAKEVVGPAVVLFE